MSDPHEDTGNKSQSSPGWTFVNHQGEIVSGDEDSESSESSIEVLSFEGNEVVLLQELGGRHSEQAEVVITENIHDVDVISGDENVSTELVVSETHHASVSDESAEKHLDPQKSAINPSTTLVTKIGTSVQTDLSFSAKSGSEEDTSSSTGDIADMHISEVTAPMLCSTTSSSSETLATAGYTEIPEVSVEEANGAKEEADEAVAEEHLFQVNTEDTEQPNNAAENVSSTASDFSAEKAEKDVADEANSACCMELLLERGFFQPQQVPALSAADREIQKLPMSLPVGFDERCMAEVSHDGAAEISLSNRSDSDADSDFVRLDSDNMDAYVGENQYNQERVVIPLRLYRNDYTVGPGFNFMRNDERTGPAPPVDNVEQDRDDDTESSTEEGVDDRIESEQSEAGSLSAQNDVGDLSVFADIGDLPLIAGDVPRNYIHRPNNHLSTVLNIIVVLVAILTMGISLGIIMATDMEIEEWQNAYEFETRKVSQLEILLKSKTKVSDLQQNRIKELESQLLHAKNTVWTFEKSARSTERALEILAAYSSQEGGAFDEIMHTILNGIKVYIQCQTESNQLVDVNCHLKLLPYIRTYAALINKNLSPDEASDVNLGISVTTENHSLETLLTEITAEAPSLAPSSIVDGDTQESQEDDNPYFETDYTIDLERDSDDVLLNQEKQHDEVDAFEDSVSERSESHSEPAEMRTPTETFWAAPVPLDVKQLQQSLTREQERALHWQQLYLSERRQKERERETEEWEDEREREMAEKERAQMDQVECLRKLMSANLTTLTQHVVRWNVSVFDDFANLSMLLSGISELQQAVLDSVQRVWKSAEQVIDSLQSPDDPAAEDQSFKKAVPRQEEVVEYLGKLLDHIKTVEMPDHDVLVEYLGRMLDHVKHGVENILNDVFTESAAASLNNVWKQAEDVIKDYHNQEAGGDKAGNKVPGREHLLEYLSRVLNDICHKDDVVFEAHAAKANDDDDEGNENIVPEMPEENIHGHSSSTDSKFETPGNDPHVDEEEPSKRGFWSRRIGKMLKKTGKTVRKLGRKVAGTWGKIKAMWHEKRPFLKIGNRLASTMMKASSKFARMCTRVSSVWFKSTEVSKVDINSKHVQKLRKQWRKMLIQDPCHILGKFSYECNTGKKHFMKDLNRISDSFFSLLKTPVIKHDQILKLKIDDLKYYFDRFKSFHTHWWKSKLLLKTDMEWVDCQLKWWGAAFAAASHEKFMDTLEDNTCNQINLSNNFHEGHHGTNFGQNTVEDEEEVGDCFDNINVVSDDVQSQPSKSSVPSNKINVDGNDDGGGDKDDDDDQDDDDEDNDYFSRNSGKQEKGRKKIQKDDGEYKSYISDDNKAEVNETSDEDASHWHHRKAKLRLHLRKEKEQAKLISEQAADKNKERNEHWNDVHDASGNKQMYSDWIFDRSKDRERKREQAGKTAWMFERAKGRRDAFHHRLIADHKKEHQHRNKEKKNPEDWFMKQAEERQKMREDEHRSDWLFARAAERKRHHSEKGNARFMKQHHERPEHGGEFRHAYGKVFIP